MSLERKKKGRSQTNVADALGPVRETGSWIEIGKLRARV